MAATAPMPDIGLSAAAFLGMALDAMRRGDTARAVECLASIGGAEWDAIQTRFPSMAPLVERLISEGPAR